MSQKQINQRPENTIPILKTLIVGFVSTSVMTAVMQLLYNGLPRDEQYPLPPEEIAAVAEVTIIGKELNQPQHMAWTFISHYGYGITLAGIYSKISEHLPFGVLPKGILYGLAVWAGSYLGWLPVLGVLRPATQFPPARNGLMIISHVIWGAVLGALTGKSEN